MRQRSGGQKRARRKQILYGSVALFLVLGLLLSAVLGFVDFITGGGPAGQAKDPYLAELEKEAASLEEKLKQDPENGALAAELGNLLYKMTTISWQQGLEVQGKKYGKQSRSYLLRAVENGEVSPEITLKIAYLALFEDDQDLADEYFQKTIALDEKNTGALLNYGLFLSSIGRSDEAKEQLEKVLEYAPEDSFEAQVAKDYLSPPQQEEQEEEQQEKEPQEEQP